MYEIKIKNKLNVLKNNKGSISKISINYDNQKHHLYLYGIGFLEPDYIEINCNSPYETLDLDDCSIKIVIDAYPEFFI